MTVGGSSHTKCDVARCGLIGGIKRGSEGSETSDACLLTGCREFVIEFSDERVRCVVALIQCDGSESSRHVQSVL